MITVIKLDGIGEFNLYKRNYLGDMTETSQVGCLVFSPYMKVIRILFKQSAGYDDIDYYRTTSFVRNPKMIPFELKIFKHRHHKIEIHVYIFRLEDSELVFVLEPGTRSKIGKRIGSGTTFKQAFTSVIKKI